MPRRREVPKRDILPDPKFGNIEVSKFVNTIMMSGKKSVAERIVYGAFDLIVAKGGKDPIEVFSLAMELGDRVYALSVQRHGHISERLAEEGMRVFDAYLGLYLPAALPKRPAPLA